MNEPSKTFCIQPWTSIATNASGNMRVCCNSTPGKNFIMKDDGSPYKIYRDSLTEAWNSPTYTTIRQQMLDGERPEMCERCFREEDVGVRSARQSWNEAWGYDSDFTAVAPENIRYVDIRLGNLCNLKCRMCNPYASSQWVNEWALVEETLPESEVHRLKNMEWFDNDLVWDNLADYAHSIEEIYLTGGEPTLAISQYRLFDKLIELGVAKKIRLKYNTNLTNIPSKMVDYWKHFKRIKINASIDAYGDLNRYIRFPTAWSSVEKNIALFREMRENNNLMLQIHITVQMYNILYLPKLLDYLLDNELDDIYLNILNHPDYLNVRVLPKELKEEASKRLESYKHIKKVPGLISYMNAEDWSHLIPRLKEYTIALDKSREESCLDACPEIGKIVYE